MTWRPHWNDSDSSRGFSFGPGGPAGWTVTKILLVTMAAVFLITTVMDSLGQRWLLLGLSLRDDNWYWLFPFLSYALVHSVQDIFHLLFNSLLIWFLGTSLEASLGRRRYLTLFFGAAIAGAVLFSLSVLAFDVGTGFLLLGASGAALGLLFFAAWETPNQQIIFVIFPLRMRTLAYIVLAIDLFPILKGLGQPLGTTAHYCHLGGAAFGYLFWRFRPDPLAFAAGAHQQLQQRVSEKRQRSAAAADAEMDRILAKINEEGMPALTKAERKFLQDRSRSLRENQGR